MGLIPTAGILPRINTFHRLSQPTTSKSGMRIRQPCSKRLASSKTAKNKTEISLSYSQWLPAWIIKKVLILLWMRWSSSAAGMTLKWRALILGTGLAELEDSVRLLQEHFPKQVRAVIKFDAPLSHRIYAGADALLMPSRYEPCGLAQMIAMRYGCIPIARATGGLADTIIDAGKSNTGTGFLFQETSPKALLDTLMRALSLYQDPVLWQELQKRGMPQDFSWQRSALEYLRLYEKLVTTRVGTQSIQKV